MLDKVWDDMSNEFEWSDVGGGDNDGMGIGAFDRVGQRSEVVLYVHGAFVCGGGESGDVTIIMIEEGMMKMTTINRISGT